MRKKKWFAGLAVAAIGLQVGAAEQCPIPTECLSLAVGEVALWPVDNGSELCIERPGSGSIDFVLMAINQGHGTVLNPFAVTGSGIVPTQTSSDDGSSTVLADSLLGLGDIHDLIEVTPAVDPLHEAELAEALARTWAGDVPATGVSSRALPSGVPVVGQLLDIQVAQGCAGSPDIRKGRVEAVGAVPASGSRLYVVQEVVETSAGSGVWIPAVAGGLTSTQFQNVPLFFQTEPSVNPPWGDIDAGALGAYLGAPSMLEENFGSVTDIDGNGGVVVFFTRALNELSPPASSTVVPSMMLSRDLLDPSVCPRSNGGEIIYMMVPDPTGAVNSNVRTVSFVVGLTLRELVRQSTRLINASRRIHITQTPLEEAWLDEGLSWAASELAFYKVSVGLAPRMNIGLANLTTGPYASRRVAAFNSYQNQIYGAHRSYLQRPDQVGMFQTGPHREVNGYTAVATYLRYALDQRHAETGQSDAMSLRTLVDSGDTGLNNLRTVFAAEPYAWLHDYLVGIYADDQLAGIDARYQHPSWHYRSVFGGLGGWPLMRRSLTNNTPMTLNIKDSGGSTFYVFGVASESSTPATIRFGITGSRPFFPVNTAVMRVR